MQTILCVPLQLLARGVGGRVDELVHTRRTVPLLRTGVFLQIQPRGDSFVFQSEMNGLVRLVCRARARQIRQQVKRKLAQQSKEQITLAFLFLIFSNLAVWLHVLYLLALAGRFGGKIVGLAVLKRPRSFAAKHKRVDGRIRHRSPQTPMKTRPNVARLFKLAVNPRRVETLFVS